MKHPFENQGNRPAWEDLTTQELDDLLAQDFAAGQDGLLEPEAILAMTEVINRREEDTPIDADVQADWENFRAQVREKEEGPEEAPAEPVPLPAGPENSAGPFRWRQWSACWSVFWWCRRPGRTCGRVWPIGRRAPFPWEKYRSRTRNCLTR